jgi:hypothetical protein
MFYIDLDLDDCVAVIEVSGVHYTPEYLGSSDEPPEPPMVSFCFKVVGLFVNNVSLDLTDEQSLDMQNSLSDYDVEVLEEKVLEHYDD